MEEFLNSLALFDQRSFCSRNSKEVCKIIRWAQPLIQMIEKSKRDRAPIQGIALESIKIQSNNFQRISTSYKNQCLLPFPKKGGKR